MVISLKGHMLERMKHFGILKRYVDGSHHRVLHRISLLRVMVEMSIVVVAIVLIRYRRGYVILIIFLQVRQANHINRTD